ncbi:hypothetical protein IQ260_21720 [Leptolyngbya cf. ectocarpi LEGE 11479]|uniref:Uncharacterized protein n=1 Tax=Leptolyngbya cf. ectocarpi LEGE 11479 TaxID=1828722 RepID=A0A928ZXI5_LEPEC|nr:hypothetical protein [Leptolyngbya ectocarpi]MBE9069265.1 hypothetical protein [Leptolyngbya cf. ectocarpi LEGE 11479]
MQITLDLPDELVASLSPDNLPTVIQLGLREFNATAQPGFSGLADILELLASLPSPAEILALKPSEALQNQIDSLLDKNRNVGLTPAEEQLWQHYEYIEHIVRIAKARALTKLQTNEAL